MLICGSCRLLVFAYTFSQVNRASLLQRPPRKVFCVDVDFAMHFDGAEGPHWEKLTGPLLINAGHFAQQQQPASNLRRVGGSVAKDQATSGLSSQEITGKGVHPDI